jgi:hypothetical protein
MSILNPTKRSFERGSDDFIKQPEAEAHDGQKRRRSTSGYGLLEEDATQSRSPRPPHSRSPLLVRRH